MRPSLPEMTGTIRRRAASSIARLAAASSGLVVVRPWLAVRPLTPTMARSALTCLSRRLVHVSTAAEVRPRIVPGSVMIAGSSWPAR